MTDPDNTAFPSESETMYYHGLTKREYFAARALQGLLSNSDIVKADVLNESKESELFHLSVTAANALIEELNKIV